MKASLVIFLSFILFQATVSSADISYPFDENGLAHFKEANTNRKIPELFLTGKQSAAIFPHTASLSNAPNPLVDKSDNQLDDSNYLRKDNNNVLNKKWHPTTFPTKKPTCRVDQKLCGSTCIGINQCCGFSCPSGWQCCENPSNPDDRHCSPSSEGTCCFGNKKPCGNQCIMNNQCCGFDCALGWRCCRDSTNGNIFCKPESQSC